MKYLVFVIVLLFSVSAFAFNVTEKEYKDVKKGVYEIKITYPYLNDNTKAAKIINDKILGDLKTGAESFKTDLLIDEEFKSVVPFQFESIDGEKQVFLNRDDIFSCVIHVMSYTGGAHPCCAYYEFNFIIDGDTVVPLTTENLFGDMNKVSSQILTPLNNEKKDRCDSPDILSEIEPDVLTCFTMDSYGVNFIFPEYSVGSYAEGEYVIPIKWEELKSNIQNDTIKAYIENTKARVNIYGNISLADGSSVPENSKLVMNLIWIPKGKEAKILESKVYNLPKGARSFPYKNSYDFTHLSDKNEYQITTEVYFDNVLAYRDEDITPITEQGWANDVDLQLENVYGKEIKEENFAAVPYIRLNSKCVVFDEDETPYYVNYYEFRLLDKNEKVVKKLFILEPNSPFMFDLAINAKELNDNYHLKVLIVQNDKVTFESKDYFPVSRNKWTLPEKIIMYKK